MRFNKKMLYLIVICIAILTSTYVNPINSSIKTSDFISENSSENLSIILMIGDGMGYEHIKLARLIEVGNNQNLTMETLPTNLSVVTKSANSAITDSAAAATAMATGQKTNNGYLGISPSREILENIIEFIHQYNRATGIISTMPISHATPAGFMVHVDSRYKTNEIVDQIIDSGVDILLGGGFADFSEANLTTMESQGYTLVTNRSELLQTSSNKILGLFADSTLPEEQYRDFSIIPSLSEMTEKAIEQLSQHPNGFFLMVEGGQIDYGGHDNDKTYVALETIAFDYAVKTALHYVEAHENTILIVTADHETGGLSIVSNSLNNTLPSSFETEEEKRNIRIARADQIEVDWETGDHTAKNVPFYAYGNAFENISSGLVIDNTDIYNIMKNYFLHLKNPKLINIDKIQTV